jgi:hypothetical protein
LGVRIEDNGDGTITLVIPLNAAFFQPDLVNALGLDTVFAGLAESQYKNDEQIDNTLRSLLFQVPGPNTTDPQLCFQDPITAEQAGLLPGRRRPRRDRRAARPRPRRRNVQRRP